MDFTNTLIYQKQPTSEQNQVSYRDLIDFIDVSEVGLEITWNELLYSKQRLRPGHDGRNETEQQNTKAHGES